MIADYPEGHLLQLALGAWSGLVEPSIQLFLLQGLFLHQMLHKNE